MTHYSALIDGMPGAYGVSIPDCPGCVAMGVTIDEAMAGAVAALREWGADRLADGLPMPPPRALETIRADPALSEEIAAGATLGLVPLLLDAGRPVRVNVSLDAAALAQIDAAAAARGLNRSAFLVSAARRVIEADG